MKLTKNKILHIVAVIFLAVILSKSIIPVNLQKAAADFDFNNVTTCDVDYFSDESIDGKTKQYYYEFTFDASSKEYKELIALLSSTKYRKHLISTGNANGYSATLNPHASIHFYSDNCSIDILLYGKDFAIGEHMNKTDYTPKGNIEFQEKVIELIYKYGALRSKEELPN